MNETTQKPNPLKNGLVVAGIAIVTSIVTVWLLMAYLFPTSFSPVALSPKEKITLDTKIKSFHLDLQAAPQQKHGWAAENKELPVLTPERYTESDASREVTFTQREINFLVANNTDLADKVAIDLSPDLISARILIPLDPDMPILGGKTLKIAAGMELRYQAGRPVVILKGVSLWGVPLPDSWLGNLKNIDLVHEYGDEGFWKSFAAGVENISVGDDMLTIKLRK